MPSREDERDRFYGLGDKTGPARPARPPAAHARCATPRLRSRARRSALQALAVPHRARRADAARRTAVFYDNVAECDLRSRLRARQLLRPLPRLRGRGRRPRFLRACPAPTSRDVTRKFVALTGRTALPPRWSLGFAQTAMALADCARRAGAHPRRSSRAPRRTNSRSARFISARATRRSAAALRLHLESATNSPTPKALMHEFHGRRRAHRRQPQALPARRSSALSRGRGAGRIRRATRRAARR